MGNYRYQLQATNMYGTSRDTTELEVSSEKEFMIERLKWHNLVDDINLVWALDMARPDLFCDTTKIKEIAFDSNGYWIPAQSQWKVGLIPPTIGGYRFLSSDNLQIYYSAIWPQSTTVQ